jgi:hypothetical protein
VAEIEGLELSPVRKVYVILASTSFPNSPTINPLGWLSAHLMRQPWAILGSNLPVITSSKNLFFDPFEPSTWAISLAMLKPPPIFARTQGNDPLTSEFFDRCNRPKPNDYIA